MGHRLPRVAPLLVGRVDDRAPGARRPEPGAGAQIARDIGQATAQLRLDHQQETTRLQRAVDRITALVGWPGFVALLAIGIGVWIAANLLARGLGVRPADPPPFFWLQGAITMCALLVATLILTTQRREEQLARHRSQLILEILLLNDQKIAKIVELIEEIRRDNPAILNRVDDQAQAMSAPSDAQAVLEAIKEPREVV
jgi:uncharacterized membrane protein